MTAARLYGARQIRCATEPVPTAGAGQELVRVAAVGLCGSDLHWFTEAGIGDARLTRPLVPGHEFAGVIEGGPRDGVRVAVDPALPCRRCETCLRGDQNLCPDVVFAGHGDVDGGLQDYLVWPTWALHPLPEKLTLVDGAMLEPLGVALHALDLGHVRIGSTAVVVGTGPIGLLMVQALRRVGAERVVAIEPLAHRRDAALQLGADAVLDVPTAPMWCSTSPAVMTPSGRPCARPDRARGLCSAVFPTGTGRASRHRWRGARASRWFSSGA
jgi:L-iditol 2-dehydrogenase